MRSRFKKHLLCLALMVLGILFTSPLGILHSNLSLLPSAHAGFFSQDLELFEEVVDLISEKYVYPPDYKKLFDQAVDEMVQTVDQDQLTRVSNPGGETLHWKDNQLQFALNFDRDQNMAAFRKVFYFLFEKSRGKASKEGLEIAAITGAMNSLDPYSQYLDKDAFDKSMRDTEGKYGGLGMVITMKDTRLVVVRTMKNSPAERAGILPEDIFTGVNGKEIKETQIQELAEMLRGYPNTKVSISLFRPNDGKSREYTLTREIISIETVEYETLDDQIGHIRITSFSKQTNDQLKEALAKAKKDHVRAFVLDLRDNPGGLLNQSVKVASHFLFRNRLIVYTQGRSKSDYKEYRAQYKKSLHAVPVVVLINEHSASASEIVAGALRDSGKALIIGENSYGKGSVQTIFRTSDGSGLRLTTSKYFTPSGTDITEHGITPEITIVQDLLGEDSQDTPPVSESELLERNKSLIHLKESEVKKFLTKKGLVVDTSHDSLLLFAQMLVKDVTVANKKQTLAKARELAANIHY